MTEQQGFFARIFSSSKQEDREKSLKECEAELAALQAERDGLIEKIEGFWKDREINTPERWAAYYNDRELIKAVKRKVKAKDLECWSKVAGI